MTTLSEINAHLAAASTAPDDVSLLHLARARAMLVALDEPIRDAWRSLEAQEREHAKVVDIEAERAKLRERK